MIQAAECKNLHVILRAAETQTSQACVNAITHTGAAPQPRGPSSHSGYRVCMAITHSLIIKKHTHLAPNRLLCRFLWPDLHDDHPPHSELHISSPRVAVQRTRPDATSNEKTENLMLRSVCTEHSVVLTTSNALWGGGLHSVNVSCVLFSGFMGLFYGIYICEEEVNNE